MFPLAAWRECSRQALSVTAVRDWSKDRFAEDDPLLIEQIRTRLLPRRGVRVAPDEILVTVGAQNALYLIASLLFDRDTVFGIENPGYTDARNIASLHAGRVIGIGVDEQGMVLSSEFDSCDYAYVTPSHQFPTTVTMALERRHALLDRAAASDVVLIEDDYESELAHQGSPQPALKSLDRNNRVIFISSLSKTLAPGLRMGFMIGPAELIREARRASSPTRWSATASTSWRRWVSPTTRSAWPRPSTASRPIRTSRARPATTWCRSARCACRPARSSSSSSAARS
jgi:GntR family transcriptional regulator/MocR family aminotransferase